MVAAAMTAIREVPAEGIGSISDERFRRTRHQAYELAYAAWLAALPEDEQRKMKDLGLDEPQNEQFGPVRKMEREEAFLQHEPVSEIDDMSAIFAGHMVEATTEDSQELEAAVTKALHWALAAPTIVEVGQRWLLVMHIWRSPLVAGLQLEFERELEAECENQVGGDDGSSGHIMEWTRRGTSLSQIGQRVWVVAYILAPAVIGSATLQLIGSFTNKTRQAVNKIVQDFRDTFGGVRSRAMRDDSTRLLCKIAQLEDHHDVEEDDQRRAYC